MRRVVHGVGPREGAGLVRERGDAPHIRERADGIGRNRKGDDPRSLGERGGERVGLEPAIVRDIGEANLEPAVVRQLQPGRHVPVVVEPRDEDLVAFAQLASGRAAEGEVQRRHVRAEDDLVGRAAEEAGGGEARVRDDRLAADARRERAADVGVRVAQVRRHRGDHLVGHLRAARSVEEDEPLL